MKGGLASVTTLLVALTSAGLVARGSSTPSQVVFSTTDATENVASGGGGGGPYGRFLHITDLHPDPHYKHDSAVYGGCHHKKPKRKSDDGHRRAGWWGTGVSDCDSPPRLIESSLQWASQNWMPLSRDRASSNNASSSGAAKGRGIDFIIWTGDSARHDSDNRLPRTNAEIFRLNRWTLNQIESAFPGVPIVPSIGNNDIFPHNILFPGPNSVTKEYVSIWRDHIPEYEFHTFEQGGYFVKELLPNELAAMSLNTLYFYDNNKAVDGCVRSSKKGHGNTPADPGTAQLDWLEVQLNLFRQRSMQVHLLGHVPPTAGNYFPRCYKRYTDIVLRYQDTVVGQHFGHMNTDAFFIQEDQEAVYGDSVDNHHPLLPTSGADVDDSPDVEVRKDNEVGLPADLRQDFSTLPGKGRTNEDYYSVFFIGPSIIPTYYPSIRVWTYNTTSTERYNNVGPKPDRALIFHNDDEEEDDDDDDEDGLETPVIAPLSRHHHRPSPRKGRKHKKKKRKQKRKPRHASPDSPSRRNTYLSLLGYSQWVMDIDEQNKQVDSILHPKQAKHKHDDHDNKDERKKREKEADKVKVSYRLEYTTYEPWTLWQQFTPAATTETLSVGPLPVPKHLLEHELKRAGLSHPFSTNKDQQLATSLTKHPKLSKQLRSFTDYALPHITVGEMMDLARKLMVDKKLWRRFKQRIYSESGIE